MVEKIRLFRREMENSSLREEGRVFLVASKQDALDELQRFIKSAYETLQIVGSYVTERCGTEYDTLVNEMNAAQPDVILSAVESQLEDEILEEERDKIAARVWYSLGAASCARREKPSFRMWFLRMLR